MTVDLNHTIVRSRDKAASAAFLTEILGLEPPKPVSPFLAVALGNGVTLDYYDGEDFTPQHYAFLVTDGEFDAIFERITAREVTYYADAYKRTVGAINTRAGGRGFYFDDPDGHKLEVFTKPPL